MSSNISLKLTDLKGQINNICQISKYRPPVFHYVWFYNQKIAVVNIGSVNFAARNWKISDADKSIKLYEHVIKLLNNSEFINSHSTLLAANFFIFDSIYNDNDSILLSVGNTYTDCVTGEVKPITTD
jgi:hypothetical protein